MMNKRQRMFTYMFTLIHAAVMTTLNVLCYTVWGLDGVSNVPAMFLISLGYLVFLILYSVKNKVKSVVPENLAIDALIWGIQLAMMANGYFNPATPFTYENVGMAFTLTPMIYLMAEIAIIITLLITFAVMYIMNSLNKKRYK